MMPPMVDEIPKAEASSPQPAAPLGRRRVRKRASLVRQARDACSHRSALGLTVLLSLLVIGSFLAVGTVHVAVLLVVAPLANLAAALAVFVEDNRTRAYPVPALIAVGLSLFCLLQSAPLPMQWLRLASPIAAQTWADAFHLAHQPATRWASVSVDPGASRVEALKWLCYAAAFIAAARLARENGSTRGALVIFVSGLLGGILCVVHGLFGIEKWLGLYQPQQAQPPWAPAPLLNANNFGGYLNVAAFTGLGLAFLRRPPVPRWGIALGVVVLMALVVLTGSRGAVLSLILGLAAAAFAYRFQRQRAEARGTYVVPEWLPILGLIVAAGSLAVIGSTERIWQSLLDETTTKLRMASYTLPLVRDHLWTGIGRGAFETAFPAYRQELGNVVAQYAENFVVQWIAEWGLPVAVLALSGLGWALRPSQLGFGRNALPTGALIGFWVLLLQNLVDLGTEVASVGLASAVLLGTLTGGVQYLDDTRQAAREERRGDSPATTSREARLSPRFNAALAVAVLFLGWIGIAAAKTGRPDAIDERSALHDILVKSPVEGSSADLGAAIERSLLRHPADPYIPLVGALHARESGRTPMSWLNQALRRDPLAARPHLLLADTLAARGAMNQALFELRRTVELDQSFTGSVADRLFRWVHDANGVLRAIPEGEVGIPLLNALAQRLVATPEQRRLRQELIGLSLQRNDRDFGVNSIIVADLMAALDGATEPCIGDARGVCEARLKRHASTLLSSTTNPQATTLLRARLFAHENRHGEAEQLLAEKCQYLPDRQTCCAERVRYAAELGIPARFDAAAAAYLAVACSTSENCSQASSWLGQIDLGRNNLSAALGRFERAAREAPSALGWLQVADVALRLGRLNRAETALSAARQQDPAVATSSIESRLTDARRGQLLRDLQGSESKPQH